MSGRPVALSHSRNAALRAPHLAFHVPAPQRTVRSTPVPCSALPDPNSSLLSQWQELPPWQIRGAQLLLLSPSAGEGAKRGSSTVVEAGTLCPATTFMVGPPQALRHVLSARLHKSVQFRHGCYTLWSSVAWATRLCQVVLWVLIPQLDACAPCTHALRSLRSRRCLLSYS